MFPISWASAGVRVLGGDSPSASRAELVEIDAVVEHVGLFGVDAAGHVEFRVARDTASRRRWQFRSATACVLSRTMSRRWAMLGSPHSAATGPESLPIARLLRAAERDADGGALGQLLAEPALRDRVPSAARH